VTTTVSTKLGNDPVVSAAIERDGRRLLELLAARNGRSLSAEVRAALRNHIARAIARGALTP
jgi:plasmid stability protein